MLGLVFKSDTWIKHPEQKISWRNMPYFCDKNYRQCLVTKHLLFRTSVNWLNSDLRSKGCWLETHRGYCAGEDPGFLERGFICMKVCGVCCADFI